MPIPVARKNYNKISNKLGEAVEKVAKATMIQDSVEVKENAAVQCKKSISNKTPK